MARKNTTNTSATRGDFKAADAFLRLELVAADDSKHRLPKDVALYLQQFLSEQMINKASADPDFEFKFVGKVHVVDNTPKADIAF